MFKDFIEKYKKQLFWTGIALIVYFLYFHNLWAYRLLDVDETRYVDMSRCMHNTKDFMTLYLNNHFFFEKPPLYFWLENLSFTIFNNVSEFTARIPGCVGGILSATALFFATKKYTQNFKTAIISSLILLSSVEFLMLSKIAILDITLATTVTLSILCGFMTFITENNEKTLYWWGFYLFSGLAVLAKGIPGIALPFLTMLIAGIYSKKLKEFFKPQYLLFGVILFLLVALPWHILMLHKYNPLFFNEYIIKHHLARFLGADVIHRQRPFWYFIPVLLWGTLPYAGSFVSMLIERSRNLIKGFKYVQFSELSKSRQYTILCLIACITTFLFFSSSGTKLVTYILPIYPFLSVLIANYWVEYLENDEHKKGITISTNILLYTFLTAGIIAFIVSFFLPEPIKTDVSLIRFSVLIAMTVFPVYGIIALKQDKKIHVFLSLLLFITFISGFIFHNALEMDYRFGQNDLINYAKYAKEHHLNIHTFMTGERYSLLYYSQKNVDYDIDENNFDKILKNPSNIIIVRKRHLQDLPDRNFKVLNIGRKYMMITTK